jgi:peptidoglycan/xylan/chitin deacetylase (PgdA/CDA1 family)
MTVKPAFQKMLKSIRTRGCNVRRTPGVLWLTQTVALLCMATGGWAYTATEVRSFTSVLTAAERGKLGVAVARVREGLRAAPESTLLKNMAGAVLLAAGNTSDAEAAWRRARDTDGDDPLAAYGLGLIAIERRRWADADQWFHLAAERGDRSVCLLARLYVACLMGAPGHLDVALPDDLTPGMTALEAAFAATKGDHARAFRAAQRGLALYRGGRYAEPPGALMTFDHQMPLKFGGRLPSVSRVAHALDANPSGPDDGSREATESTLWRMLALVPSRAALARIASRSAAAIGDEAAARRLAALAVATDPATAADPSILRRVTVATSAPGPLRSGDGHRRVVALTFDDGPKHGPTERLLDLLTRHQVRATFFVVGRMAAANPSLVAKLAQAGMEIENHSFNHPNLARLSPQRIVEELLRTSACIQDAANTAPVFFRPPGGRWSDTVVKTAGSLGLRACMWTINARQGELTGRRAILSRVFREVSPGAIILMHNGSPATMEALPELIVTLRQRGYDFVTVSELARHGG